MINFAVIFDNDGVLCNTESLSSLAFQICLRNYGYHLRTHELRQFAGLTSKDCFSLLTKRFGSTPDFAEFWERKSDLYSRIVNKDGIHPIPGSKALLKELKSSGIPYAIASSSGKKRALFNLEHAGLREYFNDELVFCGGTDVPGKPEPDLFLLAAKSLRLQPSSCIGIEDSQNGLLALQRAKMISIALTTTFPAESLLQFTTHVYKDLSEISVERLTEIVKKNMEKDAL